jgi:hypothetical protein
MDFDKPIYFDIYGKDHWQSALFETNNHYDDDKTVDLYNFYELMEDEPTINLGVWQTGEHRDFLHDYIQARSDTEGFRFLNPFKAYWV